MIVINNIIFSRGGGDGDDICRDNCFSFFLGSKSKSLLV